MADEVRVRYAPSPTGEPHVGNVRTALFNWLFARKHGGSFIVRIEDTDRERYVEDAVRVILEALNWLGLNWDEGPEVGGPYDPYFQSQRLESYQRVAVNLVDTGYAYYCYCSPERLQEMRQEQQRRGEPSHYDRHCRDLSLPSPPLFGTSNPQTSANTVAEGTGKGHEEGEDKAVVRFKMPLSGRTDLDDLIRGEVSWQNELLDDFVILKSDGFPTYHLGNVVDDHLMKITHVLRAEEWLPSTPRHLLVYQALGYQLPRFGHFPLILGPDRSKLSKRHGATSILEYREMGFLPEALVNFMVLLGWSLDDRTDIISMDTLVNSFSLERIGKGGAIFDQEKLLWMNGMYIRQLSYKDLAERITPYLEQVLPPEIPRPLDREYLGRIMPLIKERIKRLGESAELTSYFFQEQLTYETQNLIQKGMDHEGAGDALRRAQEVLAALIAFDTPSLEAALRALATELGLSVKQLFGALRVALTGRTASPPLFDIMEVLGRQRCLRRLARAVEHLVALKAP